MDFVAPQFQNPDLLRAAALGQQAGMQAQLAPYQMQQAQQQTQSGQLNLDMLRQMINMKQQAFQSYQNTMSGLNGTQSGAQSTQTGQQPGGPDPGIQNGPQGSVAGAPSFANYNPSDPLAPFLDPRRITANAAFGSLNAMLNGKDPNEPIAAALKLRDEAQASAINKAKIQAEMPGSPMSMLKAFATDPNAGDALVHPANRALLGQWPQLAEKYGYSPWDKNAVSTVAALEYNRQGGPLGLSIEVPHKLQTTQRGNGESIQTDPLTGKITAGAPDLATDKFIQNGQVVEMPKAKGMAMGLQPYDSSLLGMDITKSNSPVAPSPALEQAYQQFKATGTMPPIAGRDSPAIANESKYIAQRSQQEGINGATAAARQQSYAASGDVVKDFTSGTTSKTLGAINTTIQHMGVLQPLIGALQNGDSQALNKAAQAFKTQVGSPAPTNFDAVKEFVSHEVAKAVIAGGGSEGEREDLKGSLDRANSPDQLNQAVQQFQHILAGKTEALRNQWDTGTQGTQGSFDKFLLPTTKQALGQGQNSPKGMGVGESQSIGGFKVTRVK